MNKELQDKAWSVLPKEFKEEVKKLYREFAFTREGYYVELFGLHNLTSDNEKINEPKPSEPRFKVGDKVVVCYRLEHDKIGRIQEVLYNGYYDIDYGGGRTEHHIIESRLEPYTEANEKSRNLSQETANCDKHFDNILKDSFRNERRLNIAAIAMQGILSNPQLLKIAIETYQEEIGSPDIYVAVAKTAKEQADALIAECERSEKLNKMTTTDKELYKRAEKYFIDTFNAQPLHAREVLGINPDIMIIREAKVALHHLQSAQAQLQLRIDLARRRLVDAYLSLQKVSDDAQVNSNTEFID